MCNLNFFINDKGKFFYCDFSFLTCAPNETGTQNGKKSGSRECVLDQTTNVTDQFSLGTTEQAKIQVSSGQQ